MSLDMMTNDIKWWDHVAMILYKIKNSLRFYKKKNKDYSI